MGFNGLKLSLVDIFNKAGVKVSENKKLREGYTVTLSTHELTEPTNFSKNILVELKQRFGKDVGLVQFSINERNNTITFSG